MCRIVCVVSLLMLSKCRRGYVIIAIVDISKVFSVAGPYYSPRLYIGGLRYVRTCDRVGCANVCLELSSNVKIKEK